MPRTTYRQLRICLRNALVPKPANRLALIHRSLNLESEEYKPGPAAGDGEPFPRDWSTIGTAKRGTVSSHLRLKYRTCSHQEQQKP
jgi:hypothetical protein